MKLIVSVLLLMALGVHSNSNLRQPKDLLRKQFNGYSNSIIHDYNDQSAQSTVKVNYSPESRQIYQPQEVSRYPQQSQLFNVGYSVQFTNGNNNRPPKPKFTRNLDEGEIITGTRKQNEEVQIPNINMSPQEYVTTALIGSKKQKISGIKPKPYTVTSFPNPKALLSQANLSPTTQKYYKVIEQTKPQIQNVQDLQQKYSWRNIGPGVEIIRSTEVPISKYTKVEPVMMQFDHVKALGRSQEFDYTNAIDNSQQPYYSYLKKPQPQLQPQLYVEPKYVETKYVEPKYVESKYVEPKSPPRFEAADTKYIEEAMRNQAAFFASRLVDQLQENNNYLPTQQQAYRTIPVHEHTQTNPLPVMYKSDPPFHPEQNRFQVYGKPQPNIYSDPKPNMYSEPKVEQQRQPRFLSNLNTNLRPPPFAVNYQRRVFVG